MNASEILPYLSCEHLYDLDCVDDQHSHGKSVGKYLMVIRVKCAEIAV